MVVVFRTTEAIITHNVTKQANRTYASPVVFQSFITPNTHVQTLFYFLFFETNPTHQQETHLFRSCHCPGRVTVTRFCTRAINRNIRYFRLDNTGNRLSSTKPTLIQWRAQYGTLTISIRCVSQVRTISGVPVEFVEYILGTIFNISIN